MIAKFKEQYTKILEKQIKSGNQVAKNLSDVLTLYDNQQKGKTRDQIKKLVHGMIDNYKYFITEMGLETLLGWVEFDQNIGRWPDEYIVRLYAIFNNALKKGIYNEPNRKELNVKENIENELRSRYIKF